MGIERIVVDPMRAKKSSKAFWDNTKCICRDTANPALVVLDIENLQDWHTIIAPLIVDNTFATRQCNFKWSGYCYPFHNKIYDGHAMSVGDAS